MTDGPLFGNGELAVVFGGQTDGFSFNFNSNSFVRADSSRAGGVAAVRCIITSLTHLVMQQ